MTQIRACAHPAEALETLFVLDQLVYMTEGFIRCSACDAHFMVELVDAAGDLQLFRVAAMDAAAVQATIRSLNKGSCDINRARDEVFTLSSARRELDRVLLARRGQLTAFAEFTGQLPRDPWRDLPCDGALLRQLLSD